MKLTHIVQAAICKNKQKVKSIFLYQAHSPPYFKLNIWKKIFQLKLPFFILSQSDLYELSFDHVKMWRYGNITQYPWSCFPVYKIVILEGIDWKQLNLAFSFMESSLDRQYKILKFMYSYLMGQRSGSHVLRGPIFSTLQQLPVSFLQKTLLIHSKIFWVILCMDTSCDLEVTLHFWSRELFGLWAIGAKNSKQLKEAMNEISRQRVGPKNETFGQNYTILHWHV